MLHAACRMNRHAGTGWTGMHAAAAAAAAACMRACVVARVTDTMYQLIYQLGASPGVENCFPSSSF
jgi:hypothetical protein